MLMDTDQLAALLSAHKWVPAAALVIGLLVRLQKAGKLPGLTRIPPNYRPWLALLLGVVSGVLDKVAVDSKTWTVALLDGLLSALIAVTAHDAIIEGLRGGKEIGGGGAKNPAPTPVAADPNRPDSLAPTGTPPSGVIALAVVATLALSAPFVQACGYGATACKVIDIAQANCVWLKYLETDGTEQQVQLTPAEAREFGRAMSKKRAAEKAGAAADGGAP